MLSGGLVMIGQVNLSGSIEPINNALTLVDIAIEKGAQAVLMPVTSRRQLFDLFRRYGDEGRYAVLSGRLLRAFVE